MGRILRVKVGGAFRLSNVYRHVGTSLPGWISAVPCYLTVCRFGGFCGLRGLGFGTSRDGTPLAYDPGLFRQVRSTHIARLSSIGMAIMLRRSQASIHASLREPLRCLVWPHVFLGCVLVVFCDISRQPSRRMTSGPYCFCWASANASSSSSELTISGQAFEM